MKPKLCKDCNETDPGKFPPSDYGLCTACRANRKRVIESAKVDADAARNALVDSFMSLRRVQ